MKQLDMSFDFQPLGGYCLDATTSNPVESNAIDNHIDTPQKNQNQFSLDKLLHAIISNNNFNISNITWLIDTIINLYHFPIKNSNHKKLSTYEDLQSFLSTYNEKEVVRKKNGVYYTPKDVIEFILSKSIGLSYNNQVSYKSQLAIQNIEEFCFEKTFFEPTCGTGEFLLSVLELKCNLLKENHRNIHKNDYFKIISTLNGNDINPFSVFIVKLRIFLFTLYYFGKDFCEGLIELLDSCFDVYDFVTINSKKNRKYDFIIGNPPYVEDGKSGLNIKDKYGNIYANVLKNSLGLLKENGVIGFIIPISFISTPRMSKIRQEMTNHLSNLYVLNYSDRPDCLFVGVHQKLSIILGKIKSTNDAENCIIFTSNYQYWYKSERNKLFYNTPIIKNGFLNKKFIPKLGNIIDVEIYKKIQDFDKCLDDHLFKSDFFDKNTTVKVYLNMRCTYWMKAFLSTHLGGEYKTYDFKNIEIASFVMCLLNSSLFWWYWTVVSDCWHITQKEFEFFKIPNQVDFSLFIPLAKQLEEKLEETKVYVGTKQTEYEYKHKFCIAEIHAIDDEINHLYGLTKAENEYIKQFAYQYRVNKNEL